MLGAGAAGRDDARHHPLRPGDDRLLRRPGRHLRPASARRSSAAAQVIVYIGAISVLILFAIMLTQTKDAPAALVFQTQAGPAAIAAVVIAVIIALAVVGDGLGRGRRAASSRWRPSRRGRRSLFTRLRPAVRDRQRAAPGRGHRRRLPGQARAGRTVVSDTLDAYLILSGAALRHRHRSASSPGATRSACSCRSS